MAFGQVIDDAQKVRRFRAFTNQIIEASGLGDDIVLRSCEHPRQRDQDGTTGQMERENVARNTETSLSWHDYVKHAGVGLETADSIHDERGVRTGVNDMAGVLQKRGKRLDGIRLVVGN